MDDTLQSSLQVFQLIFLLLDDLLIPQVLFLTLLPQCFFQLLQKILLVFLHIPLILQHGLRVLRPQFLQRGQVLLFFQSFRLELLFDDFLLIVDKLVGLGGLVDLLLELGDRLFVVFEGVALLLGHFQQFFVAIFELFLVN